LNAYLTSVYIKGKNQQGSPLYHTEISMFLRGGTSQSAKYNKKSGKPYKDIDDLVDFGRPVHIVPHMFRHSFVSVMADKNVSLNVIREFVGHSEDSREIEKIYLHVMQKGKDKIEQAMIDLAEIIF
jgi:phage integrase family site specific recombinase